MKEKSIAISLFDNLFDKLLIDPNSISNAASFVSHEKGKCLIFQTLKGHVLIYQKYNLFKSLLYSEPSYKFEEYIIKDYGSYPFHKNLILNKKDGTNMLQLLLSYVFNPEIRY